MLPIGLNMSQHLPMNNGTYDIRQCWETSVGPHVERYGARCPNCSLLELSKHCGGDPPHSMDEVLRTIFGLQSLWLPCPQIIVRLRATLSVAVHIGSRCDLFNRDGHAGK